MKSNFNDLHEGYDMKTILAVIALAIALPAMANAQTVPVPAPKASTDPKMMGKMDCKSMAGHAAGSGHDMAAMKGHDMAGMKGRDMADVKGHAMAGMKGHATAGMTKQDHEKMMLACARTAAKAGTTPATVRPHKM